MRTAACVALLTIGLGVIAISSVGVAVLDDPLDRLHLVTPVSTLGVMAMCAAVVVHSGLDASGTSAILLAAVTVSTSPFVSHACARSFEVRRAANKDGPEPSASADP